ncbi:MAG TPA: DUF732 domain-containing protein [Pseudonocardiaceae bacterium]|nr:DUF732 domain-containing protein [Pseudonocardiaceae bacterium]
MSFKGPSQRSVIAAPTSLQAARAAPAALDSARNPAPMSARTAAYLDALRREDINVADVPTLLLVADSVCSRQNDADAPAQADRLIAAFPGRWTPRQAAVIVDRAIKNVCGDTAPLGANVSADVFPAK